MANTGKTENEDPSAQEAIDEALDYLLDDSVDDINSGTIKQVRKKSSKTEVRVTAGLRTDPFTGKRGLRVKAEIDRTEFETQQKEDANDEPLGGLSPKGTPILIEEHHHAIADGDSPVGNPLSFEDNGEPSGEENYDFHVESDISSTDLESNAQDNLEKDVRDRNALNKSGRILAEILEGNNGNVSSRTNLTSHSADLKQKETSSTKTYATAKPYQLLNLSTSISPSSSKVDFPISRMSPPEDAAALVRASSTKWYTRLYQSLSALRNGQSGNSNMSSISLPSTGRRIYNCLFGAPSAQAATVHSSNLT
ncbi:uncharacterized protein LOC111246454 [Varroa destructor]|uniref:Uncharacterized protein n=1 Tax=Varroa destructor TaxID=109461 RepID=A0A7M7JVN0_VARDE|nr:uncharacterized protein LOC111246454 [Varroa destructor]